MLFMLRRLAPFAATALGLEVVYKIILMTINYAKLDWFWTAQAATWGVLLLTTLISCLYLLIPYLFYILFLPQKMQNSKVDRRVTLVFYAIMVYLLLFKEAASYIFWDEFTAAFNFIAVDYLVYTNEVISNIHQSYPVVWILLGLLVLCVGLVYLMRDVLLPHVKAPAFKKRCGFVAGYLLLCGLSFYTVDLSRLELARNNFNNEAAKEGIYSLFSAFLKNELPYSQFYLTQDKGTNLEILQRKLKSPRTVFVAPQKNIMRRVKGDKPETKANVIIVLMESMSAAFLDENRPQGAKLITPNLTKLAQESLYFPNVYASGTRSVRGIEALTLGVPPLPGMSIVRRDNNENLHNIGSIFRDKGYDNKWIYGGYGYFDNMNHYFGNNGFQIVDRAVWEKNEVTFANAWGACDEDTFAKVIKEGDKSYAAGKPFFTELLTISNHRPYTYPEGRIDLPPFVSRREGGVKYADYAIGKFLADARRKPWFGQTIFVFVADHTAGAAGEEEIDLEGHHIPLFIYAPKIVKPQRIETKISQLDVLPTLLGLLNFDYESRFYGQDALQPGYESRLFVSNYQKIGYVKNGIDVILKPLRQFSVEPGLADKKQVKVNLQEAIAFYHQAADWTANLKEHN